MSSSGSHRDVSVAVQGAEPRSLHGLQGPASELTGMWTHTASKHQAASLLPCVCGSQGQEPFRPASCEGGDELSSLMGLDKCWAECHQLLAQSTFPASLWKAPPGGFQTQDGVVLLALDGGRAWTSA